jgi:peptide/nickel transport system ATP-binding protein
MFELSEKSLRKIRWRQLSYIPQGSMNSLDPVMRIKDQIGEAFKLHSGKSGHKFSKRTIREKTKELLSNVGLAPETARMYPHELSGGMKQRVVIAMAVSLNPEVIIADEPTTALDVVVQRGIIQLLSDIKEIMGSSIMIITHDIAVQAMIADRIGVMYAGKLVEISNIKDFFKDPLHPYSQVLISSVPSLLEKRSLKGLSGAPPNLANPPLGCRFHPRCLQAIHGLCGKEEPPLIDIKGRKLACHLYR